MQKLYGCMKNKSKITIGRWHPYDHSHANFDTNLSNCLSDILGLMPNV